MGFIHSLPKLNYTVCFIFIPEKLSGKTDSVNTSRDLVTVYILCWDNFANISSHYSSGCNAPVSTNTAWQFTLILSGIWNQFWFDFVVDWNRNIYLVRFNKNNQENFFRIWWDHIINNYNSENMLYFHIMCLMSVAVVCL